MCHESRRAYSGWSVVQLLLVENGNRRSREVLVELLRRRDLEHAVDDPVVEAHVIDKGARPRRSSDPVDASALRLQVPQQRQKLELRAEDTIAEVWDPRLVGQTALSLLVEQELERSGRAPRRPSSRRRESILRVSGSASRARPGTRAAPGAPPCWSASSSAGARDRSCRTGASRSGRRDSATRTRRSPRCRRGVRWTRRPRGRPECARTHSPPSPPAAGRTRPGRGRRCREPKNACRVGIPRSRAIAPVSVGSMPSTRCPPSWKFASSVPSLEPTSRTRSSASRGKRSCTSR